MLHFDIYLWFKLIDIPLNFIYISMKTCFLEKKSMFTGIKWRELKQGKTG